MHKVTQVARGLGISPTQLRNWGNEFAEYLSAQANPGKDKTRLYTDDDLSILETVAVLRNQETSYDDIHTALNDNVRLELATDESAAPHTDDTAASGPGSELVVRLSAAAAQWQATANAVVEERNHLRQQLEQSQSARLAAEIRATEAETRLKVLEDVRNEAANVDDSKGFWSRLFGV